MGKLKTPPVVVHLGNRQVISSGQFNIALVADKIVEDGRTEMVSISDLAKFAYGKSFLANNKRVRAYIWQLRRELLRRGFLLLATGRPVEHVKVFSVDAAEDRQLAQALLAKMRHRHDISADLFERAERLCAATREAQQGEAS